MWFLLSAIFVAWVLFKVWQRATGSQAPLFAPSFRPITDQYTSYDQLQAALRSAGLESSNLIVGIDFTKSNEWTGKRTFGGLNLHSLQPHFLNPYQSAIAILGRTLEAFDDDRLIPAFGFGDKSTSDRAVFPVSPNGKPCFGFQEVLDRYTAIVPEIELSGPTSFAPLIHEAIKIVKQTKSYHILVIVADGQVTNERDTVNAIVEASNYPLSIILVGVGDGPWERMEEFDDGLPARRFDNFQFVNFHEMMTRYDGNELAFATQALMEVPDQFRAIQRLQLVKNC